MFLWRNLRPDAVMALLQLLARGKGRGARAARLPATGRRRPAGDRTSETSSKRKA